LTCTINRPNSFKNRQDILFCEGSKTLSLIILPQISPTLNNATLTKWLVREGDTVARGDLLALAECEEGPIELESAVDGKLHRIVCKPSTTVPVGAPLAVVLLPGESSAGQVEKAEEILAQLASHLTHNARKAIDQIAREGKKVAGEAGHVLEDVVSSSRKILQNVAEKAKSITKKETSPSMSAPAQPSGPVVPILMPQAGNSMEEGTLLSWKVKVGDQVAKGDIVAEIETDKATMEVEAEEEGRVALLVAAEGAIVPVKEPILLLAATEDDARAWLANHGGCGGCSRSRRRCGVHSGTSQGGCRRHPHAPGGQFHGGGNAPFLEGQGGRHRFGGRHRCRN
jgi:pyruvate dehydrogenase E2 component (dihydrolipoamide acetyltransferase)